MRLYLFSNLVSTNSIAWYIVKYSMHDLICDVNYFALVMKLRCGSCKESKCSLLQLFTFVNYEFHSSHFRGNSCYFSYFHLFPFPGFYYNFVI